MDKKGKRITTFAIAYLLVGIIFALYYAYYYHWTALSYFSPPFYSVILTWPIQIPGLIKDIQYYGLSGKPF